VGEDPQTSEHETVKYFEQPCHRDISPPRSSFLPAREERKSKRLDRRARSVRKNERTIANRKEREKERITSGEYKIDRNIKKRKVR
jgi:hypothetical protein